MEFHDLIEQICELNCCCLIDIKFNAFGVFLLSKTILVQHQTVILDDSSRKESRGNAHLFFVSLRFGEVEHPNT